MINTQYDKKICQWLQENREKILADWMTLIRIPSVLSEAAPDAPYGVHSARALNTAAEMLQQRGFPVRINRQAGYAIGSYGSGEKKIGLFGHSDVVPAGDGWMFTQPFEPVIKNGHLIGRGSRDNKAGVIAAMCVLEAIRDCGIPIQSTLQAVVGSNEEASMPDIEAFAATEEHPDLSLVPDSAFPCALGEKGILRLWAECDTPLNTIRDFRGGDAFNIVLDHVEVVLPEDALLEEQLRSAMGEDPTFTLQHTEEGLLLQAKGVAKHAAYPDGGVNATALAAGLLCKCEALDANDHKALATVASLLATFDGDALGIKFNDPDFGPLTCANGMVAVEGGKLRVSLDIRYGTALPGPELEQKLRSAWRKEGWSIVYLKIEEGFSADKNSPVPQTMVDLCRELTGQELPLYRMAGGTYARHLKNAFATGLAADIPGYDTPSLEMPEGRGGAHQRDECICIDRFFQGIRILIHAVITFDGQLNQG